MILVAMTCLVAFILLAISWTLFAARLAAARRENARLLYIGMKIDTELQERIANTRYIVGYLPDAIKDNASIQLKSVRGERAKMVYVAVENARYTDMTVTLAAQ